MTIVALVLQVLLILAFFFSGVGKIKGVKMQVDTFTHLGLPQWFRVATGWIALLGVVGLIIGFWYEGVLAISALWIACIMIGAVLFHIRTKDPINKIIPAAILMLLALVLAAFHVAAFTNLL
ncbi:DoxX family protein [Paenibacillus endoradicis]|uniref:DoxX family protein n=1 Tax=Paenibacillus endoradicis TaxID=2972487 RepID=UPI0021594FE8|nr:DoxX family protein [Paenibacillus endoradicis]MCR8659803.1 DoxX family protein [Paenibacillus endoradicis]